MSPNSCADLFRRIRRECACAVRACVCVCFLFNYFYVVRIRRASFSQEPARAQRAQSAAPGPVIITASGDSEKQADEKASRRCSIQRVGIPLCLFLKKGSSVRPVGRGPSVSRALCAVHPPELHVRLTKWVRYSALYIYSLRHFASTLLLFSTAKKQQQLGNGDGAKRQTGDSIRT